MAVAAALGVVGVLAARQTTRSRSGGAAALVAAAGASGASAGGELVWVVGNSYTQKLGKPIGSQYAWVGAKVQVIDPYRAATLSVTNAGEVLAAFEGAASQFAWTLGCSDGSAHSLAGARVELSFVGVMDCSVRVELRTPSRAISADGLVKVRYVRREVRELDDADRDLWLDSLFKMWSHGGDEGRQLFGPAFISSDELLSIHATNSALRDNDHFHNGAGFLAQHVRLDNMVSKSLQAIDASISAPYWDWTIESRMVEAGDIESPFETPLWTAGWFGSLNFVDAPKVVGQHYGVSLDEFLERGFEAWAIRDGRWAFSKVQRLTGAEAAGKPVNSYGYLRSPWNNNPSPYVTRINFSYDAESMGMAWPTCSGLYAFITPQHVSAVWFMTHLEDMTIHAAVHQALGGTALDVRQTQLLLDLGQECYQTVIERHLWRAHLLEMVQGCDPLQANTTDAVRACQLACDAETPERIVEVGRFFLEHYACDAQEPQAADFKADVADWTVPRLLQLGAAVCSLTFIKGEHLEASGTTDPSFFITHPTLARYYQLKRLSGSNALVDDWPSVDASPEACVPAIDDCYSGYGQVEEADGCCAGHFRYSRFFTGIDGQVPTVGLDGANVLTNEQVMLQAEPTFSGEAALIFHHLDWDHCAEDFASLLAPEALRQHAAAGRGSAGASRPPADAGGAAMMN
ncbi:hypothetical protein M885DRAFT_575528 [Pelagophyceae sp. CCMP2097]|nr:hypothetical protein M885DRAFT_575528 [Pelagophyceae sp. CCMP2097]